jgi:hypothetical protein
MREERPDKSGPAKAAERDVDIAHTSNTATQPPFCCYHSRLIFLPDIRPWKQMRFRRSSPTCASASMR